MNLVLIIISDIEKKYIYFQMDDRAKNSQFDYEQV